MFSILLPGMFYVFFLFLALLHWLDIPVRFLIRVITVNIFAFIIILRGKHSFFFFFLAVVFSVYAPNQFEEVLNHSYSLRRFIVKGWMFNFVKCVFINIMMLSSAFSFSLILSWCVKLHWRVFKNQARHIFSESTPLGIDYYYFYTLLDPVY